MPMTNIIKFTFEETEALINVLRDTERLTPVETSALAKLRKIQARQILSHEKRQNERDATENNNAR